jgi:HEAT repeat protein
LSRRRIVISIALLLVLALVLAGAYVAYYRPLSRWSQWVMPDKLRIHALIHALRNPDAQVREGAAQALGWIGPGVKDAVPALIKALGDPDLDMRWWAAEALGQIGLDAEQAIPELERLTEKDPREWVRKSARDALEKI